VLSTTTPARAAAGASGARHSLRPLIGEGETSRPNLAQHMRRDREAVFCNDQMMQTLAGMIAPAAQIKVARLLLRWDEMLVPVLSGFFKAPFDSPRERHFASDCRLRHVVKEVQSVGIEREAKPVVNFGLDARFDRGHHRVGTRLHVEKDLRSEFARQRVANPIRFEAVMWAP